MDDIRNIIITEIFDIVLSAIILKIYFKTFFTEKEVKYIRVYIPTCRITIHVLQLNN